MLACTTASTRASSSPLPGATVPHTECSKASVVGRVSLSSLMRRLPPTLTNTDHSPLHPDNWQRVYLDALRVSFRHCQPSTFLHSLRADSSGLASQPSLENLHILRGVVSDPSKFHLRDFPTSTPDGETDMLGMHVHVLSCGCASATYSYQYLYSLVDFICSQIYNFSRYGIKMFGRNRERTVPLPLDFGGDITIDIRPTAMIRFQATQQTPPTETPPPILTLLDLHPRTACHLARRTSSHATIVAYLLSLAQAELRFRPDASVANPYMIGIRYKSSTGSSAPPSIPVFVMYTATISRHYLDTLSSHHDVESAVAIWQSPDFDCTNKEQMEGFAELLLELCPALVQRAIADVGGDEATIARAECIERICMEEWSAQEKELWKTFKQKKRARPLTARSRKKVKTGKRS